MNYTSGQYDPVSRRLLWWVNPNGSSDIYGTAIHAYGAADVDRWLMIGGSSGVGNSCTSHLSASPLPWPGNRHVCGNWMIDRSRHVGVLVNGVCATNERADEYHYALNLDPLDNTWTEINEEGSVSLPIYGWLVHDTVRDLYIAGGMQGGGGGEVWVKAPTATVNATQIACGALTAQTWYRTVASGDSPQPTGNQYNDGAFNTASFDPAISKVRLFSNRSQTSGGREHWLYDPPTQAWSDDTANVIGMPSYNTPQTTGYKDTVRIASGPYARPSLYLHHKDNRAGDCTGSGQTYLFNGMTNTYTPLAMTGTGPQCGTQLAWDELNHLPVTFSGKPGGTGMPAVYHGLLAA